MARLTIQDQFRSQCTGAGEDVAPDAVPVTHRVTVVKTDRGFCVAVNGRVPGDSPAYRTAAQADFSARVFFRQGLARGNVVIEGEV